MACACKKSALSTVSMRHERSCPPYGSSAPLSTAYLTDAFMGLCPLRQTDFKQVGHLGDSPASA